MLRFSFSMTLRDWRAGELRFLLIALALAVASLTAVQFFSSRMGAAMQRDAHQLLAADLRIAAEAPIDARWRAQAATLGLRSAATVELNSMALAGEGHAARSRMVALKAVEGGYPLRGTLSLHGGAAAGGPPAGSAWVDPALLERDGLAVGSQIRIGELRLTIARSIASEPDRGPAALVFAPRVMISMEDMRASGLLASGALADYYLLLAGEAPALASYQRAFDQAARKELRLETLATSNAAASGALDKAAQFLSLIGLLSALLASVAVAMAARRFMLRHQDAAAMLRCLGMPQSRVLAMFGIEFALVGAGASAIGAALGFGAHFVLIEWLGTLVTADMAPPGWAPALTGIGAGIVLLLGFALPPLLELRDVPHSQVLRGQGTAPRAATLAAYGLGLGLFGALMVWQAGDLQVGLLTLAAFGAALLLFMLAARAALACLRLLPPAMARGVWRLALADLRRHPAAAATQIVALAVGLMALLLLTVVRGDLLASWKDTTPPDAPNHVILNIDPGQRAALDARLAPYGAPVLYPLVRARIVSIAGKVSDTAGMEAGRARDMLEREVDMSSAAAVPPENTLTAGRWFSAAPDAPAELSVAENAAGWLGIKLGQRVVFDVAGTRVDAVVTSLRKVNWRSRQSNFIFLLSPGAARALPAMLVTSVHIPAAGKAAVHRLADDYPNLTVIDTGAMVDRFQALLAQVAAAVEFLFLFTLAAGLLVLYATLLSSQDERVRQGAILRALGATGAQLARARWIEFGLSGALSGILAAAGATGASWALARFAFKLEWHFSPLLWAAALAAGAACALLGAWVGLRAVLASAPLHSLRTH